MLLPNDITALKTFKLSFRHRQCSRTL